MGVGKQMKTFLAAMNEQMSGYGPQIKNTPMGPFRWNDVLELWENVNNGMVMNNVSFQDMFIMGYETNSGDNGGVGCIFATTAFTTWTVSLEIGSGFTESSVYNFTNTCPITLTSEIVDANADLLTIQYKVNGGVYTHHTLTENITIPAGATFQIQIDPAGASTGNARFRFRNSSDNNTIVWGVNVTVLPEPP